MDITRRDLPVAGALAHGGMGLWRRAAAVAASADEAAVAQGVEALRKAIVGQEQTAVVGTAAVARHTWASESATDGKTTSTTIGVLQVWQQQGGTW